MAAGFSESYIRLWNLKGGKLPGLRSDFDSDEITDGSFTVTRLPSYAIVLIVISIFPQLQVSGICKRRMPQHRVN